MKHLKELEEQHRRVLALCKEDDLCTIGIEGVRNMYAKNERMKSKPGYGQLRELLNKAFTYYNVTRI